MLIQQTAASTINPLVDNFDQTIYLIDQMIEAGEDIWQVATDAANYEESETDKRRWNQCDIAARIAKKYGDDAIGKFATDANIPKRRAQEYRTMGTFWFERSARAQFLKDNPHTLTYSHLRLAARIYPDAASAMRWLERAERKSRSVDQCEYIWTRAKRIYGDGKPKPVTETFGVHFVTYFSSDGPRCIMDALEQERLHDTLQKHPDAVVKLVIEYEATKESA